MTSCNLAQWTTHAALYSKQQPEQSIAISFGMPITPTAIYIE